MLEAKMTVFELYEKDLYIPYKNLLNVELTYEILCKQIEYAKKQEIINDVEVRGLLKFVQEKLNGLLNKYSVESEDCKVTEKFNDHSIIQEIFSSQQNYGTICDKLMKIKANVLDNKTALKPLKEEIAKFDCPFKKLAPYIEKETKNEWLFKKEVNGKVNVGKKQAPESVKVLLVSKNGFKINVMERSLSNLKNINYENFSKAYKEINNLFLGYFDSKKILEDENIPDIVKFATYKRMKETHLSPQVLKNPLIHSTFKKIVNENLKVKN